MVAPPNRGSLNSAHIFGTLVPGGGAVHSINRRLEPGRIVVPLRLKNRGTRRQLLALAPAPMFEHEQPDRRRQVAVLAKAGG
jgi:hypothetical protein